MSLKKLINYGVSASLSIVAVATVALIGSPSASAQDAGNSTLKVAPLRSDISINPGESKNVKITVSNPTEKDIEVRPIQHDFVAEDEKGTPAIILDEEEYAPKHSLKRYMTPLENVTVPAKGNSEIEVEIVVPKNAEPGGYFGAVRFDPVNQSAGAQVNMSTSVASLILLRVKGDVVERLTLTDFDVQQSGRTASWFMDDESLNTVVRFENSSVVQLAPIGSVSIMKGDKIISETEFNSEPIKDVILPDSARRWEIPVDKLDGFGKYTVMATFAYGESNQTAQSEYSFWLIPRAFIIGGIASLIVLIIIVVGIVVYIKKRPGVKKNLKKGRRR